MRNLTVKRTKSFVGCLVKLKVYIEDPTSSELVIRNVPCRKIGELRNGEEKTFSIGENESKLFVIADTLSKDYCNDFYRIPAGQDDVYISGKNKFNPVTGNAFRFDGVADEEVLQNRKKSLRKGIVILCISLVIGFIIGIFISSKLFWSKTGEPKVFSTDGMQITLTNNFSKTSVEGYTVCYDSRDVAVFALEETFASVDGFEDYTIEQYGDLLLESNSLDSSVTLQKNDDLNYFEYQYTNPKTNDTYKYTTFIYKTSDAFWAIQFATLEENADNYRSLFNEWAKKVKFD